MEREREREREVQCYVLDFILWISSAPHGRHNKRLERRKLEGNSERVLRSTDDNWIAFIQACLDNPSM